jgi:ParB/Sulfiredoxin domain
LAASKSKKAAKPKSPFKIEVVRLAALHPHPRNYRGHPQDQIAHLVESLKEHGVYRNVVAARDGTILAGEGIWRAAQAAGLTEMPIQRMDLAPDEPRAIKLLVGDNELSHLAEDNDRLLSDLLKQVRETDTAGLLGTGYDETMLANLVMVSRPEKEVADFDAAKEWVGMPQFDTGEKVAAKLVVSFRSETDAKAFFERLGVEKQAFSKVMSMWYPPRERDDVSSVRFEM